MAFDIGVFYNVLKDIHSESDKKRQSIITDVDLSPDGKSKRLAKIDENRQKAVSQLQETFETAYNKQLAILDKKLNVSKESAKDKAKAYMDTQLVKDFNLSTYHDGSPILDDNSRTALILDTLANNHRETMDFFRQASLSQGNESWYRTQLQKGLNDKNIERVKTLRKSLDLKADDIADKLIPEYDGAIKQLEFDSLTDGQRQALADKQSLTRDKELLDYSFKNVSERGEYADVRQVNRQEPVNDIRLVRPNIHRQFANNKSNT